MQIPDCKCRGWGWWRPRLLCWTTHQSTVWTIQVTAGQVFFLDFLLKWGNLSGSCWNYSSILWVILDLTEILSKGEISTFGISKKMRKGWEVKGCCYVILQHFFLKRCVQLLHLLLRVSANLCGCSPVKNTAVTQWPILTKHNRRGNGWTTFSSSNHCKTWQLNRWEARIYVPLREKLRHKVSRYLFDLAHQSLLIYLLRVMEIKRKYNAGFLVNWVALVLLHFFSVQDS